MTKEFDNDFIAEALGIEIKEDEELSLQMLEEFKDRKGDSSEQQ